MTNLVWDGTTVLDGPLSVIVPDPDAATDRAIRPVSPIAFASTSRLVVLDPAVLGAFLARHGDATIACFDVASTFDRIESIFCKQSDKSGIDLILGIVRSCRLHDIQILCPLIELGVRPSIAFRP